MRYERIPASLAGLLACLFVGLAGAADPVPKSDQVTQPKLVASPSAPAPQQPPPGVPVPCDVGKFVWLEVKDYAGAVTWDFSAEGVVALLPEPPAGTAAKEYFPGVLQGESVPQWHKSPSVFAVPCMGVKAGFVKISAWGVVDGKAKLIAALTVQVGPQPPPKPDVTPKPDEPKPLPVVSTFRVILIYESGQTMPQGQHDSLTGESVSKWLTANCTGGKAGWRLRDKDANGDADATMAGLWNAVKPKVTTVPSMAVEVNGQVEIVPLPAIPAATVAKLEEYRKGK